MMDNYFNPYMISQQESDMYKGLSDEERFKLDVGQLIGYITALAVGLLICAVLGGCTTPKVIEQYHHHTSSVDTLSVQAMVDSRVNSWHEQMDSAIKQSFQQYSAEWFSHEDEKEVTTETVTSWVDSLGRQMRQEQRTTERTISREQQQREERLAQEFETRLQTALSHQDSVWQSKFNALQAHWDQSDSTSVKETPVPADNRPWYQRWWDNLRFVLLGIASGVVLYFSRKILHK